jgi:actin cytoskeleton-regulatory complex protein SLA1
MGFLGVYRALYDYTPQSEGELQITEGDLLYLLEQSSEDDWWKVKKKASAEDEEEPDGLVPSNYIEQVSGCSSSRPRFPPKLILIS